MRLSSILLTSLLLPAGWAAAQEPAPPEVPQEPSTQAEEAAPDSEEAEVRRVFQAYKDALLEGDGETAAGLVDSGTLAYFESIQSLALAGSEEEVRARPFVDRLLVVTMRHELDRDMLATMDLEDLLRHAIAAGWIGKASIRQLDIGEVEISGDEATGLALTGGAPPPSQDGEIDPLRYSFIREDGVWKFRFGSLVASLNRVITQFAQQMGANEDDLIFTLVQAISGRQVLPDIWSGPRASEPEAPQPPEPEAPQAPEPEAQPQV